MKKFINHNNDKFTILMKWGLGIGDWGLGIGDWAPSPIPNPQSPIRIIKTFKHFLIILPMINNFI